jgi:hypothetical protein
MPREPFQGTFPDTLESLSRRMAASELWQKKHLAKEAWETANRLVFEQQILHQQYLLEDAIAEMKASIGQAQGSHRQSMTSPPSFVSRATAVLDAKALSAVLRSLDESESADSAAGPATAEANQARQARTAPAAAPPFPSDGCPKRRKTQLHVSQARPMAIVQARTASAAAAPFFPDAVCPKRRKTDSDDSMSESETLEFDGTGSIMMLTASCVCPGKRPMHADSEPAPEGPPASAPAASAAIDKTFKTRVAMNRAASEAINCKLAELWPRPRLWSFGDAGYLLHEGDRANYDEDIMPKQVLKGQWKMREDRFHAIHRVSQLYQEDVKCNRLFRSLVPIILPNLAYLRFFNQNYKLSVYDKVRFIESREHYEEKHWQSLMHTRMRFTHRSAINCKPTVDHPRWTATEAQASSAHLEEMFAEAAAARPVPTPWSHSITRLPPPPGSACKAHSSISSLNISSSNISNSSSSTMD